MPGLFLFRRFVHACEPSFLFRCRFTAGTNEAPILRVLKRLQKGRGIFGGGKGCSRPGQNVRLMGVCTPCTRLCCVFCSGLLLQPPLHELTFTCVCVGRNVASNSEKKTRCDEDFMPPVSVTLGSGRQKETFLSEGDTSRLAEQQRFRSVVG